MSKATRTVGFIGLGIMGKPMAGHLLAAGLQLWGGTGLEARRQARERRRAGGRFTCSDGGGRPRGDLS